MTYKSTSLSTSQLKLAGFVEHSLIVPLKESEKKRQIWMSPDVAALISGEKNPAAGFPTVEVDRDLARFGRGFIVSASRRTASKAEFKWLLGHDEVWVWSLRKPAPGWRIFGRFARKNLFVAMRYFEREELTDNVVYNAKATEIPSEWACRFPGIEPCKGLGFDDYLGEMHRNDDE